MPAILAALGGMLLNLVGSFVGRALLGLGLGVMTYTGVNASLEWLKGQAVGAIGAMGADVVGMLSLMKVGQCISIVCSAILARQVINGVQSDTFKKWVLK